MKILIYLFLFGTIPKVCKAQLNFNFFISNTGKNSNPGTTEKLPKKTLEGSQNELKTFSLLNGTVSIGLKSSNIFNESLISTYSLKVGTYSSVPGSNNFAILDGSDVFDSGWTKINGTKNVFNQVISYEGFNRSGNSAVGDYSYIYVIEIDKKLEESLPYTSRRILKFASSLSKVDSLPGSFYEPKVVSGQPLSIFIHTSDGASPNNNSRYRYEVTTRDWAINAYKFNNNVFENLWVRGYGAGSGYLPSGANSYYNKIIFGPGAATHHLVVHNGSVNNSLFLPGPQNIIQSSIVFYDFEGLHRHNTITNSIFLDINNPIYTHTHGTATNYGALELSNIVSFADSAQGASFLGSSNTDSVLLNNVYTDKHTYGFNYSSANYVSIRNSYFKDINRGIFFGTNATNASVNNVFIMSNGNDDVQVGVSMRNNTTLKLSNSIIHIKSNNTKNKSVAFTTGSGNTENNIFATNNIFICNVNNLQTIVAASVNTDNGIATSKDKWDNNVYILLKGKNIVWSVTNKNSNGGNITIESFEEWKRQSGQDKNSLFFDLRNDPRGLQAIFIDPENGNYELANTVEGNKIKDIKAGMFTPLTCFLKKPTYEEAAEMIKTGNMLKINSCKLSCQQTDVKLEHLNTNLKICENQVTGFKGSGDYKENDLAYHQSDLSSRYLWWFADETDTSGINLKTITHKFSISGEVKGRLQIIDNNGCSFDTNFISSVYPSPIISVGKDTTICKGSEITLTAKSNFSTSEYLWSTGERSDYINVKDNGLYWVQATLNGCTSRDSIRLKTENCSCTYQLPNSFSPNGDGINDTYNPFFTCPPITYSLAVFNRFGELVFKSTDYKNSWNGLLNGKPLSIGVYVYILNFTNEKYKDNKPISGSITLLR